MMRLLASFAVSHAVVSVDAQPDVVGGYSDAPVGQNETTLLTKALASDASYDNGVVTRLCYVAIESLKQQVVAGMNYEFTVSACTVDKAQDGKCAANVLASCAPTQYKVVVYEQVWTNTTRITSIRKVSDEARSSMSASASGSGSSAPTAGMSGSTSGSGSSALSAGSSGGDGETGGDGEVTTPTSTLPAPAPAQGAASKSVAGSLVVFAAGALTAAMV